jgi:hypothetical protein
VSIRAANIKDLEQLVALGKWMHKESPRLSRLTYSHERAEGFMRMLLTDLRGGVFVSERRAGEIVGFIAGFADAHLTSNDIVALVSMFFILPDARVSIDAQRLVCVMRSWAAKKGAKWVDAGVWTGIEPEKTAKLYEAFGYTRCSIGLEAFPSSGDTP